MQKVTDELNNEIRLLREEIVKSNSFPRRFVQGILAGLGGVIGATIVVSIVLFVLSQLENISFLEPFIKDIVRMVEDAG